MSDLKDRWKVNSARGAGRGRPLRDLWMSRDIVRVFVARDLQLRYRQAALGMLWVVIQPLATVGLLSIVFGQIQGSSGGAQYVVFALVGMILWQYFSSAVSRGSEVFTDNPTLITKVWFPRISVPVAALLSPLVDLAVGAALLLVAQLVFGVPLRWTLLLLPLAVALAVCIALGAVLFLSAINVRFRDVRHAVGPLLQILFFATPVAYSLDLLPAWGQTLVAINPLTGVIELARWTVFGSPFPIEHIAVSIAWAVILVLAGSRFFKRAEWNFADVL